MITDILADSDEGTTCLTAIRMLYVILHLKMEWKFMWPGQTGIKIRKWGWVIWFLSMQRSIKKAECFIVCALPTPLPKQSALLLLANMYLANIYNFISYLPVLFNLLVSVIRSKGFGRQSCHQEALKTAPQTQQLNKYSIFSPKKYLTEEFQWMKVRQKSPASKITKHSLPSHKQNSSWTFISSSYTNKTRADDFSSWWKWTRAPSILCVCVHTAYKHMEISQLVRVW